jgi:hypothetical protein
VVHRDRLPKQNCTGGIFDKITPSALDTQNQNTDFVETGLTGWADISFGI